MFVDLIMSINKELKFLKETLNCLKQDGKILVAILYGSYARGIQHKRSDIDIAVYINTGNEDEEIEIIDKILMTTERQISMLRFDDDDESPFVVQEALKGVHLIEPDNDILYEIAHRALHETEDKRFRRSLSAK